MPNINTELLRRLENKLGVGRSRVYARVEDTVRDTGLPRPLAAIVLAMRSGLNIAKFSSEQDLAQIRSAGVFAAPKVQSVIMPATASAAAKSQRAGKRGSARSKPPKVERRRGTSVFVVHGRNEKIRNSMFAFLRSIGLEPQEWSALIARTKRGTPSVSDILDKAFDEAVAFVVLLTPDDLGRLKPEFVHAGDEEWERNLTGQARLNVLFEAGMAFGKFPNQTVLVEVGKVRPFSDIGGKHATKLNNTTQKRQELIIKLANAGCNVSYQENTDWHTQGDFELEENRESTRKTRR